MLEKGPAKILTVRIPLRKVKLSYFTYKVPVTNEKGEIVYNAKGEWKEERRRKIGMTYFLMNIDKKIEAYTLKEETDYNMLKILTEAGRCYVFADVNWACYDAKPEEFDCIVVDNSLKLK